MDFRPQDREEAYGLVRRTLVRLDYEALGRAGKGTVLEFLGKATGFSRAQVTRLVAQHRETGRVEDRRGANSGRPFARVYTPAGHGPAGALPPRRAADRMPSSQRVRTTFKPVGTPARSGS